ncbi:DUF6356 family protein [Sphingomonas arenae]|uniref:DUF6356 family protein n=1 Tax=Sphingomonas arenae TaxID=2812555 RepID=UPI001968251E|nr:DUF6356 family protein [Sphingomonas arenae]
MKQRSALSESQLHLEQAGEGYFQHLRFAVLVGLMLIGAGLACVVHALVPALCTTTASRMVDRLTRLFGDRSQVQQAARESSGALTLVLLVALATPVVAAMSLLSMHAAFAAPIVCLTLGVPIAYLWTNPGLDPVE